MSSDVSDDKSNETSVDVSHERIRYETAAKIAKESVETGKTVRELCLEQLSDLNISEEELTSALDPSKMTEPSL